MKIRTFVFDMDGVLFDTERYYMEAWRDIAKEWKLGDMEPAMHACVGMNRADTKRFFLENYGSEFPYDDFMKTSSERYMQIEELEGLAIMTGAYELLDYLKKENYRLALASSTRLERVLQNLDKAGMRDYFEVVVAGDMVEHSKPSPDIYLLALSKLGVDPAEAYAVEDSPNGIRSAHAAGMKVIMVPDMIPPTLELEKMLFSLCRDLREVKYMLMGKAIQRIPLEGLSNTRDLGGFPVQDGRKIKSRRLIRSGALIWGSEKDLQVLQRDYNLKTIVDFRTAAEREEKPDPVLDGVDNIWNPILEESTLGITREGEGTEARDVIKEVLRTIGTRKNGVEEYMRTMYMNFVSKPHGRKQYSKFFELLLKQEEGAILWHCSAGKDRVGMGTALLLTALGVPEDVVLADYMCTNTFGRNEVSTMMEKLQTRFSTYMEDNEDALNGIRLFFAVEAVFLTSAFEQMKQEYGSIDNFLEKEMGLTPEKRQRLQEMYLE